MTALTLTQLSISMEDGTVSRWLVEDGAHVSLGQPVVEVETDKATIEIEAPADGRIRIVAVEGAVVVVDGVLGEVEADSGGSDPAAMSPVTEASTAGSAVAASASSDLVARDHVRDRPIASPAARRIAVEAGVDLASLRGSGPGGRIVARDVDGDAPVAAAPVAPAASSDRLRDAVVKNITA